MDRMVAKGVLTAKKTGKLTIYQSAVTRAGNDLSSDLRLTIQQNHLSSGLMNLNVSAATIAAAKLPTR